MSLSTTERSPFFHPLGSNDKMLTPKPPRGFLRGADGLHPDPWQQAELVQGWIQQVRHDSAVIPATHPTQVRLTRPGLAELDARGRKGNDKGCVGGFGLDVFVLVDGLIVGFPVHGHPLFRCDSSNAV